MLFMALGNIRAGTSRERLARRVSYTYPPGLKKVAEYITPSCTPAVISIAEADDIGPIMAATSAWDDVLSWTVLPCVTAEDAVEMFKRMTS